MMVNLRQGALVGVLVLVGVFVVIQRQRYLGTFRSATRAEWTDKVLNKWFSFVPADIEWCEVLFEPKEEQVYPELYNKYMQDFFNAWWTARPLLTIPEGHSGDVHEQQLSYSHLANLSWVNTICETGFNAGHSTFIWLTSNPKATVYSFDLGIHEYSKPMAEFLQKTFPGRLTLIWGDSTKTVPEFIRKNPTIKCDLIIIDGGHAYPVAKADMRNSRAFANKERNLLVLDDYPRNKADDVKTVWLEELSAGQVEELWKCQFYYRRKKGFTVGRYIGY